GAGDRVRRSHAGKNGGAHRAGIFEGPRAAREYRDVKVLMMLASSSVTGPAEPMLHDAHALRAAGHTVHLACDTRRPGNLVEAIRALGFPLAEELHLCQSPGAVEVWRDIRALRARLRAESYDLVH